MEEHIASQTNEIDQPQASTEETDEKSKLPRHPRWTIHEIFILIQGKQIAENRDRVSGSDPHEPKWDLVSSFCKCHGVKRGPVQCRKKWSNIICDFRKIKTWESQVSDDVARSFWTMQTDFRREMKLPGFFDREIYEVLDGKPFNATAYPLRTVRQDLRDDGEEEEEEEEEENNGNIFAGSDKIADKEAGVQNNTRKASPTHVPLSGMTKEKQPGNGFCRGSTPQKKRKREEPSPNEGTTLEKLLITVLDKNISMVNAQLEAQNMSNQLDRELRKDQNESLVAALDKIADCLGKIADKL